MPVLPADFPTAFPAVDIRPDPAGRRGLTGERCVEVRLRFACLGVVQEVASVVEERSQQEALCWLLRAHLDVTAGNCLCTRALEHRCGFFGSTASTLAARPGYGIRWSPPVF